MLPVLFLVPGKRAQQQNPDLKLAALQNISTNLQNYSNLNGSLIILKAVVDLPTLL